MSAYRTLPWKKNIRKIPAHISAKIDRTSNDEVLVVAATKTVSNAEIGKGTYAHLDLSIGEDGQLLETKVTPLGDVGQFSNKNQEGWTEIRRDLPKIVKTFSTETPNFGDWSYGSHTVSREREVYQREYHEPRDIPIAVDILRGSENCWVVRFTVENALRKGAENFENDLLFCLNLLQENAGAIDIHPNDAPPESYLAALQLEWEIFPPGTIDEVVSRLTHVKASTRRPEHVEVMRKRVKVFSSLDPVAYIYGVGGMNHYIGAKFADDLVVFENVRYGNALYVLYEDWELISRRSRSELLKGTDADFDRIIHSSGWEGRLKELISDERRDRAA